MDDFQSLADLAWASSVHCPESGLWGMRVAGDLSECGSVWEKGGKGGGERLVFGGENEGDIFGRG